MEYLHRKYPSNLILFSRNVDFLKPFFQTAKVFVKENRECFRISLVFLNENFKTNNYSTL
jgi:hypothetical protein